MKPLGKVTTFLSDCDEYKKTAPLKIAAEDGYLVDKYEDLVEKIAIITFHNPELNLFYRGQPKDYKIGNLSSLISVSLS